MQQCGMDNCDKLWNQERIVAARNSILHDFYVDDYITSIPTVEQAKQSALDVKFLLAEGHFHLRK